MIWCVIKSTGMIWVRDLWIRWSRWEFWPAWLFHLPAAGLWCWYAIRSGHPLFFTRVNPAIPLGGLLGESKWEIMQGFPENLWPRSLYVPPDGTDRWLRLQEIRKGGWTFPLVVKPDIGERGYLVRRCASERDLLRILASYPTVGFILQEYVEFPEEYSVMYHRFPGQTRGQITSLCRKGFLRVTGDGRRTVAELLAEEFRGRRQVDRLIREEPALMAYVPEQGEVVCPEPIGNHCRGTVFLDAGHEVSEALTAFFDDISNRSQGFYYGRFDLRCRSLEAMIHKQQFRLLEYNGVSAEPAHIYHPGRSVWRAYRDVARHWGIVYRLSRALKMEGVPAAAGKTLWTNFSLWWNHKNTIPSRMPVEKALNLGHISES